VNKRKMTTLAAAGLAGLAVPVALSGTASGQQQTVTTCPAGVTAPSPYCTVTTVTAPPAAPPAATPGPGASGSAPSQNTGDASKSRKAVAISVTATPKRDRKAPFKYAFRGKITPPTGTACAGKVQVTVKRGKKQLRKTTGTVSKSCTFKLRVSLSAKTLKTRKGKLSIRTQYLGSPLLQARTAKQLSVRFG
jgi:hypothetical protein